MFKKLKAFTLAEALIVIAIIGVIAVVSLPVIKNKLEIEGYHAALKKNYYVLKTALDRYGIENYGNFKGGSTAFNYLKSVLNVRKSCSNSEAGKDDCAETAGYSDFTGSTKFNNIGWGHVFYDFGQLMLDDGTLIMFGRSRDFDERYILRYIWVDVNGYKKGPNRIGVDLYLFQFNDGELFPMGAVGTEYTEEKHCSTDYPSMLENGFACANKVIMQGR